MSLPEAPAGSACSFPPAASPGPACETGPLRSDPPFPGPWPTACPGINRHDRLDPHNPTPAPSLAAKPSGTADARPASHLFHPQSIRLTAAQLQCPGPPPPKAPLPVRCHPSTVKSTFHFTPPQPEKLEPFLSVLCVTLCSIQVTPLSGFKLILINRLYQLGVTFFEHRLRNARQALQVIRYSPSMGQIRGSSTP